MIYTTDHPPFDPGQRVTRAGTFAGELPDRPGVIVARYQQHSSTLTRSWWCYAVRWEDTGEVKRGYFHEGLIARAPTAMPVGVMQNLT